ncbi:hypothetical protein MED222_06185 [Vibrio sp. MED222]|nr:hypothetical protein MED222_06185 [Vibrio sp. MED222]
MHLELNSIKILKNRDILWVYSLRPEEIQRKPTLT